jgi:hypothetical protein
MNRNADAEKQEEKGNNIRKDKEKLQNGGKEDSKYVASFKSILLVFTKLYFLFQAVVPLHTKCTWFRCIKV